MKEFTQIWLFDKLRSEDRGLFLFCLILLFISFYSVFKFNLFTLDTLPVKTKSTVLSGEKNLSESVELKFPQNSLTSEQFSQKIFEPGFFEVEIPEKISSMSEKITLKTSQEDELPTPLYRYYSPDFQRAYEAGFEIYSPEVFQKLSVQQILDLIREDQNKRFKGTSIQESTIQINSNLVRREFQIKPKKRTVESFYTKVLIIVSQPKIFILTCSSKRNDELFAKNSDKFFQSFILLENQRSKKIQLQETINWFRI